MYFSLLLLLSSSSSFCLVRSLVVVVAVGVLGRALPLVVFAVVLRNALSNSRAKRAGESEREAVQSSLGLLCRSEAALYVSQLLRFGVIRWDSWAVIFASKSFVFHIGFRKELPIISLIFIHFGYVHGHVHAGVRTNAFEPLPVQVFNVCFLHSLLVSLGVLFGCSRAALG